MTSTPADQFGAPLAAVLLDDGAAGEPFLTLLARDLAAAGWRLGGAVQVNVPREGCLCDMELTDLASGRSATISEDRGPLARGCRLDLSVFETLTDECLASIDGGLDLVIVNKFGRREAEGGGFRPVIEAALARHVPVLVGLRTPSLEAWRTYVGEDGIILDPDRQVLDEWLSQLGPLARLARERAATAAASRS
jgi:nucleoside-triphosphatase THEP1